MRASCGFPYDGCKCFERMGNDFWFLPADRCLYEEDKMALTPTQLREIYAEELRKIGESNRAERVLDGSDTNGVSIAAFRALLRVADLSPKQALFGALMNRLDEVGKQNSAERPSLHGDGHVGPVHEQPPEYDAGKVIDDNNAAIGLKPFVPPFPDA
jgi:hypothetical protein